jgi:hypothetical protein
MMNNPEGEMENLSKAIVEAILASGDVKKALEKVQASDSNAARSLMVFMLRLDSIAEFKDRFESEPDEIGEFGLEDEPQKQKRRRLRKKNDLPNISEIIDGKIVSRSEKKFLDFLANNFDQVNWLKKNGIKLD